MAEDGFTPAGEFDWEAAENFPALLEGDFWRLLARVCEGDRAAVRRRAILRGRVDPTRAELVDLGVASLPPGEAGDGGAP